MPWSAMSVSVWAGILFVSLGLFTTQSATCRTSFTQQPLLGYRCVLSNSSLISRTNAAHAQCVWRCLSNKNCVVINHNFLYNYCEIGAELCDHLEPNEEFIINVYGAEVRICLQQWVPVSEYDPQRAISFPKSESSRNLIAVGRVLHKTDIYPTKHRRFLSFNFRAVVDNRIFDPADGEVLLLGSDCLNSWVMYSVSQALPVGAVVGGHIEEELLYVARVKKRGEYSIGYLRKERQMGYFAKGGVLKTDTMEILVVL